ncbi:MAG: hypothetical protein OXI30_19435 [Chloroflexota bacterium]|nr:hypothetical protein [Chloroflexota bacterium]
MPESADRGLSRAPLTEIIFILLQHFRPVLTEADLILGADEARELAGAIAAGRPHVKSEAVTRTIAERVESRLDALQSRWGLGFTASLRADMAAIGPWSSTAEFLALANDKAEAETDIALGASLLLAVGRRGYGRYLLETLEHDDGALDIEAAIARRILLHVSGIDGARENGLARLRRWLENPPL